MAAVAQPIVPLLEQPVERRSVEAITAALDRARVRYLVARGVAVVAHGHVRFTADLDLVLDPDPDSLRRAIEAIRALGYKPRAPVAFGEFANPEKRREWREKRGMMVFSLSSPEHVATELDLFLEPPFDFDAAHARAAVLSAGSTNPITFVGREDLLALKRAAGRPQDLLDVEALESLRAPPGRLRCLIKTRPDGTRVSRATRSPSAGAWPR